MIQRLARPQSMLHVPVSVLLVLLLGGAACEARSPDEPTPSDVPSVSPPTASAPTPIPSVDPDAPPWGIDEVGLPADKGDIVEVFDRFPDEVAGESGGAVPRGFVPGVSYGKGGVLFLYAYTAANFNPLRWDKGTQVVRSFSKEDAFDVEASDLGNPELIWFAATEFPGGPGGFDSERSVAFLATPGSPWVFVAVADTPELRAELMRTFADTIA